MYFSNINNWLFFNRSCYLCRLADALPQGLCSACLDDLPRIAPACRRCALPLSAGPDLVCGRCLRKPPPFDSCLAAFAYRFPLSQLIPQIKYQGQAVHLGWLADVMALEIETRQPPFPQILIPVPLAPPRLHSRGYNQAALLAGRLGRRLELPVDDSSLAKPKDTAHQMELAGSARRRNLRNAFSWKGPAYGHVALIDDVMTTGTTVSEICRLLKKSGIGRVDIWVLARTPAPQD
ncbi:ComF family protein [Marinobacterium aestuariivivens]|uniref:ComF family protein n=1 Tax=Marinobacterium aestuariivivens TaxID=1698799 RepID=A0ABW1ZWR7_9GAMM